MNTSSFSVLLGVVGLMLLVFGGFIMAGGDVFIIVEALPHELMTILGGALATTFILTSAGGPGTFKSLGLALQGRRFQWGDYRLLAATLKNELSADSASARSRVALSDDAAAQAIRDAKALLVQKFSADHIGSLLQSRIDAMLIAQRGAVIILQVFGRSLLWFGAIATLLGAIHTLGAVAEPAEVLGGMTGSASTGITLAYCWRRDLSCRSRGGWMPSSPWMGIFTPLSVRRLFAGQREATPRWRYELPMADCQPIWRWTRGS